MRKVIWQSIGAGWVVLDSSVRVDGAESDRLPASPPTTGAAGVIFQSATLPTISATWAGSGAAWAMHSPVERIKTDTAEMPNVTRCCERLVIGFPASRT